MAVLQKLRGWGIVLSILVALPLLLFIVDPQQIMNTVQSVSSRNDIGKINGKAISYMDFQEDIDRFQNIMEIMTGSSANGDEGQQQVREAAWQNLIQKYLFEPEAEAAGIQVGKEEMIDLTIGDNVSPIIAGNPFFMDENGQFSPERLTEFVQVVNGGEVDARYAQYWEYLQESVKTSQLYGKYSSLFSAAGVENNLMLSDMIKGNNETATVEFVMDPYTFAPDSSIVISDHEIRNYYNSHKNLFRQQASRDIEYAVFEVVPSADDITAQGADFTRLYDEFATTENIRSFLQRNSDTQYMDYFFKPGELNSINAEVEAFVAANNAGTSPVIQNGNNFYAARILETATLPDSVYVRHIMLQGMDAKHVADSLVKVVKPNNFATLATLYSADSVSAADGEAGNLGWMTQNMMIDGFESVLTAKVGVPYVITTQYGTHVVEVTKATKPNLKKKVAIFEKETLPSKETINSFYNKANRLATIAGGKLENFQAAADSTGAYLHPMTISEATDTYGTIGHAKEVTRWAFDNKPGKVSQIITIDNNYFFVVGVKDAHKEGPADVKEVASQIRNELYSQKYAEARKAEVAQKIAGLTDLQAIAEKLNTTVNTEDGVAFSALTRPLDPKFIGAIAGAKEGEIAEPLAGTYGIYIFKVTGRETGSYYTEDDARMYNSQMAAYNNRMILPTMMEDAGVKDNRARFY